MNKTLVLALTFILSGYLATECYAQSSKDMSKSEPQTVFAKGQAAPSKFFTGNAYVTSLISNDSVMTTVAGEVFFEAGARSNWHSHPAGQILIITAGVGYHQIKGKPIEVLHKGDVVKCPPDVDHWHGASKSNSMAHIYILPNTEKGIVEWKEPVTDDEYGKVYSEK